MGVDGSPVQVVYAGHLLEHSWRHLGDDALLGDGGPGGVGHNPAGVDAVGAERGQQLTPGGGSLDMNSLPVPA